MRFKTICRSVGKFVKQAIVFEGSIEVEERGGSAKGSSGRASFNKDNKVQKVEADHTDKLTVVARCLTARER